MKYLLWLLFIFVLAYLFFKPNPVNLNAVCPETVKWDRGWCGEEPIGTLDPQPMEEWSLK